MSSTTSSPESILVEVARGIGTVTFNRPERHNALDEATQLEFLAVLAELDRNPAVDVLVLTGIGRTFCAGGDIKALTEDRTTRPRTVYSRGRQLVNAFLSVEKPIIAKVNGPAMGLGATIALLCDVVIAASDAKFGDTHVNVGLVAGDGGAVMWPLLVGPLRAKEFLLTGQVLNGERAAELGLINRSVPVDQLDHEVLTLAERIRSLPPFAVRATKASVNRYVGWMVNHVLETSLAWEHLSMETADHREAIKAFAEKRPGRYTGR